MNVIRRLFLRDERGLTAVETAMMLPLFILILMGVIDFGRLYWTQNVVTAAANEGARLAILADVPESDVQATIEKYLQDGGIEGAPLVNVGTRVPEQPLAVSVKVDFEFLTLVSTFANIFEVDTVTATAVMLAER